MTRTLNVYLPNPDAPEVVALQVGDIDPRSAIVGGEPEEISHGAADRIHIYFEGNRFNAANVHTFADKAMMAGYRCVESAPTIAQRLVLAESLVRVGTLYLDHKRVEVEDGQSLTRLAKWLDQGTWDGEWFTPELDAAELRTSPEFSR